MWTVVVETNKKEGQQKKYVIDTLRRPEILISYENSTVEVGFYESSPLMKFFSIPLRFPISPYIKNAGFCELLFLWTSALIYFF